MTPSQVSACQLKVTLPATHAAMETFVGEFRLLRHCCGEDEAAMFGAELLLREALTNAVEHGCQCQPAKQVHCTVRLRGRRLTIAVTDEGNGFDWRASWNRKAKSQAQSGRGLEIMREYATMVRFNNKGNSVTIVKQL